MTKENPYTFVGEPSGYDIDNRWRYSIGLAYAGTARSHPTEALLQDACLNLELFYGLADARWTIEAYRRYFNEQRLHGALGYVPPAEFKQQWLAKHSNAPGALPSGPRDLSLCSSEQKAKKQSRPTSTYST